MNDDIKTSWERFLNPETLRSNLIIASIFISAFEILKECILERPKEFYTTGFDENGLIVNAKYKKAVLSLNKSPVYASLSWLKDLDAIEKEDIELFSSVKKCRNELAHELPNFITTGIKNDPTPHFSTIISLISKIEKWWIANIEIPTNPDFDGSEINKDEISPGRLITLRLLTDIALGSEAESKFYYDEFLKKNNNI